MELSFVRLLLLAAFIHSSIAIRCFICQSRSNPACQDPIKSYQLQLTECTPDIIHASSRELGRALTGLGGLGEHLGTDLLSSPIGHSHAPMQCQKISFNVGDERVVIRGCHAGGGWSGDSRAVCRILEDQSRNVPYSYINYCDTCDRDACNGARNNIHTSPVFALLAVLIPTIFAILLRN